jgi:hypothetical protein
MVSVWKIGNTAMRRLAGSERRGLNAPEVGPTFQTYGKPGENTMV